MTAYCGSQPISVVDSNSSTTPSGGEPHGNLHNDVVLAIIKDYQIVGHITLNC